LAKAHFIQSSKVFTELLDSDIASVAYKMNGKQYDLKVVEKQFSISVL